MASEVQCCVCKRQKGRDECEILVLTDKEKEALAQAGDTETGDELAYCKPCWRVVSDRQKGADLQKGLVQVSLQQLGVPTAEAIAESYRQKLLSIKPRN